MIWCRISAGLRLKSPWMKIGRNAREGVFLMRVTVSTTSVQEIGFLSRWWIYVQMIIIGVLWSGCLTDIAVQVGLDSIADKDASPPPWEGAVAAIDFTFGGFLESLHFRFNLGDCFEMFLD